jgi:hypothetical protein
VARAGEEIDAASMPLTRLATTALDLMPARRGDAVAEASGYAETDLLCYRASFPANLAERQRAGWQPWLDWAERHHDARLALAPTLDPVPQPAPALAALRLAVERLDDWRLVGLHAATALTGSLVLALALERGDLDAERAFATRCSTSCSRSSSGARRRPSGGGTRRSGGIWRRRSGTCGCWGRVGRLSPPNQSATVGTGEVFRTNRGGRRWARRLGWNCGSTGPASTTRPSTS